MTAPDTDAGDFHAALGCLVSPAMGELAARLASVPGLDDDERATLVAATGSTVSEVLHARLARLLLLELNAARVKGRLHGHTPPERWREFLEIAGRRAFWDGLAADYPDTLARVTRLVDHRLDAAEEMARAFAADREDLGLLLGRPAGRLRALSFGAGDSHRGGRTVALMTLDGGRIVYKPRSLAVDAALGAFVDGLVLPDADDRSRIRVPRVLSRAHHGWCEFIDHVHAADRVELAAFYRGIGHWLAVMRLLGGSDLHAENLIARGPCPVVVDCETLFTPRLASIPCGLGDALDRAVELVNETVLSCGLLPGRGAGLGWHGVDSSGLGGLPSQQPRVRQLDIVDGGSDRARLEAAQVALPASQNLPSDDPPLAEHWPDVIAGFDALSARLREMDARGELAPRLEPFASCTVRVVPRGTEVYAEVGRMLWHPVSLHKPREAVERARDLLHRQALRFRIAPSVPDVIAAEVDDLCDGDIPFFTTVASQGELEGPRGTTWLRPADLVEEALANWRAADFPLERRVIRAALVCAYIQDGWMPEESRLLPARVSVDDLDSRRRRQAAAIVRELVEAAIPGRDGTVTWIAPVLNPSGWTVQPAEQDLYSGASGLALLVAGYRHEVHAGRADPVDGLDALLDQLLQTLRLAEGVREAQRERPGRRRPTPPGGYIGLGSQIWTWLALRDLGVVPGEAIERACGLATWMPESVAADTAHEMLLGKAGAIAPLLRLAKASGQRAYLDQAIDAGDRLLAAASGDEDRLWWPSEKWPDGLGGFAHGATGIGWALARLGRATGEERFARAGAAAFRFEDALWDPDERNWLDLRRIEGVRTAAAWCHGAVGIGLARLDLDPTLRDAASRRSVRDAADAAWRMGLGWNHSPCHGDLGVTELVGRAIDAGLGPAGLTRDTMLAQVIGSMEEFGATCGITRDTFSPGLMPGLGGVAWQLLRLHPDCLLPSVLVTSAGLD